MALRTAAAFVIVIAAMAGGIALSAAPPDPPLVAGGTEFALAPWTPGEGMIGPGAKIRNWSTPFRDILVGPAGDYASSEGLVVMNCDLDETVTGPCWGTFEFENALGRWVGTWQGRFNFVTGAGSYKAQGHGEGGLKGMVLDNDVVYPGYAFGAEPPMGYVYSTVKNAGK